MKNNLTPQRIKELLHYGPETGIFTWKVATSRRIRIGDVAGSITSAGYRVIWVTGTKYRAHRLAWLYVYGEFPHDEIDHINGDKLDNRIINLRDVTRAENSRNSRVRKDNTSGVMGVSWSKDRKKWLVLITVDGKQKNLGLYEDIELAALVRCEAEVRYGYHKNHGRQIADQLPVG